MRKLRMNWILLAVFISACGASQPKPDEGQGVDTPQKEKTEAPKGPKMSEEGKLAYQRATELYKEQQAAGQLDPKTLISAFESALDEDSKLAEAHYNLGCIYESQRNDEKAQEHYRKALEIRPDLTLAAANWGALLTRHQKLDEALSVYQRAISEETQSSPVLLNMAAIYIQMNNPEKALSAAAKVLTRDPTNVGAYRIMAQVYLEKGDLDMAHLICLRGLKVKEKDPRLANTLGLVLLKLKRVPEALVQFRLALEQVPDMITTRINVAKIALDYRDFRVAREEFQKILELDPQNRIAELGLGISLRGVGEFDAAKQHFETMAQRNPKNPQPHYWLGMLAFRNFNDLKAAREEFKKYADLSGDTQRVTELVKELDQNVEMQKRVADEQKKMEQEAKDRAELEKKLTQKRKELFDQEWARAEKEGDVLPPQKLKGEEMPFVLVPLAVSPEKPTKVMLVGAVFGDIKTVEIGRIKAKWNQVDKITVEMIVPRGLDLGAWDVQVTFKDKDEEPILFQGGLWVGKKPPKKKEEKPKDSGKKDKESKEGKPPKEEPKKTDQPQPKEPGETKASGEPIKSEEPKESGEPKKSKEPKEPGDPKEPTEPTEP